MQIQKYLENSGSDFYYEEDFRNFIETFIPTLVTSSETTAIAIDPQVANKYNFDFYGLLKSHGITMKYRWIILRMNGYTTSSDYKGEVRSILIPDSSEIERIRSIWSSGLN